MIAAPILKEIKSRLGFLQSVGLEYLTLSRASGTLSGGESQRIRLATQIGSSLMGVLYILDEPSIGLHQRDNHKLLNTLKNLRDLGNTVIVVEHDEDTMREADFLVDIGPGAGVHGGEVVFCRAAPGDRELRGLSHGPVFKRQAEGGGAGKTPQGQRQVFRDPGRPAEQPEKRQCKDPPGGVCLCHRGVRLGQILPHQRDPL